jgi:hypothetical protein
MNQSPELQDLYLALAIAQGEIGNATKESENPGFKRGNLASKYADLASVRDAYREPFSKNGLALIQIPTTEGKKVTVITRVAHKSGQFIEESMSVNAANETPQAIGSAITYIRRYAAMCFTGVAPEEDDGNAASARGTADVEPPARDERPPRQVDPETERREAEEAARDYVRRAKLAWAGFKRQSELRAWWVSERELMIAFFSGKDDPFYIELKTAFAARGADLEPDSPPAEAKVDATGAPPAPKPGEPPRPALETLRVDLRDAVKAAKTEDEANDAYTRIIEPFESQLEKADLAAFVAILRHRVAEL